MRHAKTVLRLLVITLVLSIVCTLTPSVSAADREGQLQRKIQQIINEMPSSVVTDADKSLYFHDYIVKNVAYEMVGDHQSAYGALLDGKAVCAGYADAYKRLLNAVGINATTITGYSYNSDGEMELHAWTMLTIDGKCLFTDVTWDDPFINGVQDPTYVAHDYFHLTLEQMNVDHFPDDEFKSILPSSCNHTGYDFYTIMQAEGSGYGIFNENTTVGYAVKYFKYLGVVDGKDEFYCEFRFDGDGQTWIQDNWVKIAQELGLTGSLGLRYQYGGSVLSMTVSGKLDNTVEVSSITLNCLQITMTDVGETFQLIPTILPENATFKTVYFVSSDTSVASVSQDGLITALSNGTAVITATSASANITASCLVVVSIPEKATDPTQPTAQPTTSPTQPTVPTTQPTQPTVPPTQPTQPTVPPTQPTQPTTPPYQPPTQPTQPSTQPTAPTLQPTQPPTTKPTDPTQTTEPPISTIPTSPSQPSTTIPTDLTQTTEPTVSTIPAATSQPTDPVDPVDPTEPTTPTEPTQPIDPTDPVEPTEPQTTEATIPEQDATETEPTRSETENSIPQESQNNNNQQPSSTETNTQQPKASQSQSDDPKSSNTILILCAVICPLLLCGVIVICKKSKKS